MSNILSAQRVARLCVIIPDILVLSKTQTCIHKLLYSSNCRSAYINFGNYCAGKNCRLTYSYFGARTTNLVVIRVCPTNNDLTWNLPEILLPGEPAPFTCFVYSTPTPSTRILLIIRPASRRRGMEDLDRYEVEGTAEA